MIIQKRFGNLRVSKSDTIPSLKVSKKTASVKVSEAAIALFELEEGDRLDIAQVEFEVKKGSKKSTEQGYALGIIRKENVDESEDAPAAPGRKLSKLNNVSSKSLANVLGHGSVWVIASEQNVDDDQTEWHLLTKDEALSQEAASEDDDDNDNDASEEPENEEDNE